MKKSKLRNIIKESIKELMNEQFLPLAFPTTTVGQGNDIAYVQIKSCSGGYTHQACLNNHSQYEIGHQFKFYDVNQNVRTGYLDNIVASGEGSCPSNILGAGQYLFNPIEALYVGACENNPNAGSSNTTFSLDNIEDAISLSQTGGNIPNFSFKVCQLTAAPAGPISDPQSLGAGDGCFNYAISNPTTDELESFLPLVGAEGYFPSGNNSCEAACIAPEPEFQSIGDTEYDPGFFDGGINPGPGNAADQGEETGFQFPEGFDPADWMNSWVLNLYPYLDSDMSGVCDFLSERISTWTNQYESAGPLYQNQLVFKIQAAYMIQSYLPCSGSLEEQAMGVSLPSNLTSLINSIAKKTASNLMKSLEQKTRMKKLANIPMDKPMNTIKPLDKPEEKGKI